jgi:ribosomal protein S18 acetylase RimI-like enzyme
MARKVLNHLEATAAAAGADWMVLETGSPQPEAVALYRSSGYQPIPAFGHYATSARSIHLGKRLTLAP